MKKLFDEVSCRCSEYVTHHYSTSFSKAVTMLAPSIRSHIHNIYGFVRFADEIVDTFHDYDKETLLNEFENEYYKSLDRGISLNPILNSFQQTVKSFNIDNELVSAFLKSMRADLSVQKYEDVEEINEYIYGSADVVGLMCLKVFVGGDQDRYDHLKFSAMKLGSAFQKVNFLRDLKHDVQNLSRSYFPGINMESMTMTQRDQIIEDIEKDFADALIGIQQLPKEAKFGVYVAYIYYRRLLSKIKSMPLEELTNRRIRVSNTQKASLLLGSYFRYQLNLV
ncbi:phytoene/squalene synthase family protein [Reichenbachiella versicolor]|uniref:phytoene/squalene synthase family protein n=1 Tax=Reichenbachiella versicolor TaxID=1821036 RepID=UPI000D6E0087|nr:phytoene/squalene synthase family protein [Reichenbachiella versicolor]